VKAKPRRSGEQTAGTVQLGTEIGKGIDGVVEDSVDGTDAALEPLHPSDEFLGVEQPLLNRSAESPIKKRHFMLPSSKPSGEKLLASLGPR